MKKTFTYFRFDRKNLNESRTSEISCFFLQTGWLEHPYFLDRPWYQSDSTLTAVYHTYNDLSTRHSFNITQNTILSIAACDKFVKLEQGSTGEGRHTFSISFAALWCRNLVITRNKAIKGTSRSCSQLDLTWRWGCFWVLFCWRRIVEWAALFAIRKCNNACCFTNNLRPGWKSFGEGGQGADSWTKPAPSQIITGQIFGNKNGNKSISFSVSWNTENDFSFAVDSFAAKVIII